MDHTTSKNKILVLGRPEINKARIVDAVISQQPLLDLSSPDAKNDDEMGAKTPWELQTRYYQASLEFWVDSTEQLPQEQAEHMQKWLANPSQHDDSTDDIPMDASMNELQAHLSEVVDAIVFAFDPTNSTSFTDILPWARFSKVHEPGVLLCVAVRGAGNSCCGQLAEEDKDAFFKWCVVNGWEWLDLTDTDPETEYTAGRLREALVSNEWANMVATAEEKRSARSPSPIASDDGAAVAKEPQCSAERSEWDGFDYIARSVDPARIDAVHQALFGTSEGHEGDVEAVVAQIRNARNEISQMDHADQSGRRSRAAELALAVAKRL
ncbi:hypothetical protein H4R26_000044 [Coemansia thaxteri]|uniref:Increased recombination centers protein 6 n=1 Tax=Coemansia thaxteri TaxID=2663907 RepID=A0A9W8EHW5_9FUNG|nr:hypothetical protein H4R26_000044 [Coemansia thaxteri]KAJ2488047.1 hypothetical protein EV174_000153 [Coemansia sp. RSA 2320]